MSDLIDRQVVIDLLKQMRKDGDMVPWEGKNVFARIRMLPALHLEECTEKRTETHACDLISRQAAIDVIMGEYPDAHYPDWYASKIRALPSAQPYTAEEIQKMQELESAQVERAYELGRESVQPTGTWLIHKWGDDAQCSNCGKTFKDVYDMDNYDQHCRHCGTHMKGIRAI